MMSTFRELVLQNRSYRRFEETCQISKDMLIELVDLARQTASASNKQPIKYVLSTEKKTNDLIFPCLTWAAHLKDWKGPKKGQRPSAYIVLLIDQNITKNWWCDDGIAAQTILLGAVEKGLGGCMLGAINKKRLQENLKIPEHLHIRLVIALGKPAEQVMIEDLPNSGDTRYWRDEFGNHHVPKRSLEEVVLELPVTTVV